MMPRASIDPATRDLQITGSEEQIALAQWIADKLAETESHPAASSYPSDKSGDATSIVYLRMEMPDLDFQQILTTLRLITRIDRLGFYSVRKAAVFRGTVAQTALAVWLVQSLDRTQSEIAIDKAGAIDLQMPGADSDTVRVFYLPTGVSELDLQAVLTDVRRRAHVGQSFACRMSGAVIGRGTAVEIAAAQKVVDEFRLAKSETGR